MKLLSLNTAGIALIVLSLVMPTGAVPGAGEAPSDTVWEDGGVVLSPANGSNGEYAEIGSDGNLSVDLASVGLNPDAVTVVEDVFRIDNHGDQPVRVWITHDGADAVTVFAGGNRTDIVGNESELELDPGEGIAVGFRIDTHGHEPGETLMQNLRVHAYRPDVSTPTPTVTPTPEPPESPPATATPNETETPRPNETVTPTPNETVTVTPNGTITPAPNGTVTPAPNGTEGPGPGGGPAPPPDSTPEPDETDGVVFEVSIEDAQITNLGTTVPDEADRAVIENPRAIITAEGISAEGVSRSGTNKRRFDALVLTNTTVSLDGQTSLVSTSESVDQQRRLVKVVDITPPAGMEDERATIQVRINKSRLNGSDPETARIGRRNDTGWQLFETRIVEETEEYVRLEAETPGFSVFGVWLATDVEYRWEIETVGTRTGQRVDVNFPSPGVYNATLTVTDSFGRSDITDYRILANDRPDVSLQAEGNLTAGTPLNLTANVSDQIGATTITWKFEDGTSLIGTRVMRSFEPGRHVIEITVEDEYGATRSREFAIRIPEPDSDSEGGIGPIDASIPQNLQSGIVGGLGVSLLLVRRRRGKGEKGIFPR